LRILLRGLVDIFGRRIDAAGCERHVVFECACRIPDVAGEAADEIGARALLFASLILESDPQLRPQLPWRPRPLP
jgi:hypothetical protein